MSNFYPATVLTGGGTGALDAIDGAGLADGDASFVVTSEGIYFYFLDADSGLTENSPYVISPDANAGTKRWIYITGEAALKQITVFPRANASGAGVTSTIGNAGYTEVTQTGSSITVASVADISSPSSWTNLVSLTGKGIALWSEISDDYGIFIDMQLASTEGEAEALRVQVLVDGTVAWDQTVTKDTANATQLLSYHDVSTFSSVNQVEFKTSFVIRAARRGDLTSTSSWLKVGEVRHLTLA